MKRLYSIPNKMIGEHETSLNAIIDTWKDLLVTQKQFESTIYDTGVQYAIDHKIEIWIVDTSTASNVFGKEVRDYIEETVAPRFAEIGIKYFFMVLPQSAISRLSAKNVLKINDDQEGMQTINVSTVNEAKKLLSELKAHS